MSLLKPFYILQIFLFSIVLIGCRRSSYDVWEDTKTCSRHLGRGFSSLAGNNTRSRAVCSPDEFYYDDMGGDSVGEDFIPLVDESGYNQPSARNMQVQAPRETPGENGSSIPGIESFSDPSLNPNLAHIFRNIYFDYDSSYVKGENLSILRNMAQYLMNHPNMFVFIEGHCDEKGPEAYNLALGSRRAHAVRNFLVQEGVHPDHLFTISYGKERPLVMEHHEEAWSKNRRAEFKIYNR